MLDGVVGCSMSKIELVLERGGRLEYDRPAWSRYRFPGTDGDTGRPKGKLLRNYAAGQAKCTFELGSRPYRRRTWGVFFFFLSFFFFFACRAAINEDAFEITSCFPVSVV